MSNLTPILVALAALPAGCSDPPVHDRDRSLVFEAIDRTVEITEPIAARLYVEYRAVSYAGRVAEYGVELGGRPLVITYAIDPGAALPLQTRVFDPAGDAALVALLADDQRLEIYVGDDPRPITVAHYTDPAATTVGTTAATALDDELRPLLDAVLPARAEIAPVPAFWRNLDERPPPADGVGQSSSAGRPVLPAWSASMSLLGALFVQGPCVHGTGYACPCLDVELPAVGHLATCP